MRDPPKDCQLPASVFGNKKSGPYCMVASTGPEALSNSWTQHKEQSLSVRWNRMMSWPERAISMLEASAGCHGWMSTDPVCEKPEAASGTNSAPCSTAVLHAAAPSTRYKTELCRTFTERGVCKYGSKCQFAHGAQELRGISRHPKYKTEPCRTFHSIGFCPYGIRCHFVHNNEDEQVHGRPGPSLPASRRPPLRQSLSFAGFPSTLLETSVPSSPFLRAVSPPAPAATTVSDLLTLAFPELGRGQDADPAGQVQSLFLPSPDSGCSLGELTPTPSPSQTAPSPPEGCPGGSPLDGAYMGTRSQSLASLSDQEGGCSSSSSSLSGSDSSSVHEGTGRRLPIFSQLSVPDDGFSSEGSTSGTSFFL
ncbi:mRNA decay activator protein ZFP36L1 isoform X2 [Brachyhypopomus gauderio]